MYRGDSSMTAGETINLTDQQGFCRHAAVLERVSKKDRGPFPDTDGRHGPRGGRDDSRPGCLVGLANLCPFSDWPHGWRFGEAGLSHLAELGRAIDRMQVSPDSRRQASCFPAGAWSRRTLSHRAHRRCPGLATGARPRFSADRTPSARRADPGAPTVGPAGSGHRRLAQESGDRTRRLSVLRRRLTGV